MKTDFEKVAELLARYVESARLHGIATCEGNWKVGNKQYAVNHQCFLKLKSLGLRERLIELLDHEDDSVRTWAALHCLEIAPARAEETLAIVGRKPGPIGFDADMTLREWKAGNLKLP